MFLGLDTSNYTTSAAAFDGKTAKNAGRLLPVRPGELGLRQSDAVFAHIKQLPQMVEQLFDGLDRNEIQAVAASTRPRAVEGSYMPCFLVGESFGRCLAQTLDVPFYSVSHQQGHIAAAAWSAGRMDLLDSPHLAWHLSGGTTELLLVQPDVKNVIAQKIGGTTDISAGQVIDRTGVLLDAAFPAGKALDALAAESGKRDLFRVKLQDLSFSFSGLENKVQAYQNAGNSREDTAAYCIRSVADLIFRATVAAQKQYPDLPVIFSGGVSSNKMLRELCSPLNPIFAAPEYSTDNALGVAVLCSRQE